MAQYSIKLRKKEQLADHVYAISFDKPEGFTFEPGQFVQFFIPQGEAKTPRSYSISSLPQDDYLLFCIKYLPGGVASAYLEKMQIGDELEIGEALGRFTLNNEATAHTFVGTGTGIAPIYSMITSLIEAKSDLPITVIYGVRCEQDMIWHQELLTYSQRQPNITLIYTLSQPSSEWTGERGRVTSHLEVVSPESHAYLCGSAPMVIEVKKMLLELGLPAKHIHFEIF